MVDGVMGYALTRSLLVMAAAVLLPEQPLGLALGGGVLALNFALGHLLLSPGGRPASPLWPLLAIVSFSAFSLAESWEALSIAAIAGLLSTGLAAREAAIEALARPQLLPPRPTKSYGNLKPQAQNPVLLRELQREARAVGGSSLRLFWHRHGGLLVTTVLVGSSLKLHQNDRGYELQFSGVFLLLVLLACRATAYRQRLSDDQRRRAPQRFSDHRTTSSTPLRKLCVFLSLCFTTTTSRLRDKAHSGMLYRTQWHRELGLGLGPFPTKGAFASVSRRVVMRPDRRNMRWPTIPTKTSMPSSRATSKTLIALCSEKT